MQYMIKNLMRRKLVPALLSVALGLVIIIARSAAVDLLVPGSGELMGGSQREHRLDRLCRRMDELHISREQMDWYVNLRRFGGCVHSGFGMGFERLIMYLTGVENIRDVIPYPRTPGECEF